MSTKIDQKWAQGIRESVNALILEIERLEEYSDKLEKENAELREPYEERGELVIELECKLEALLAECREVLELVLESTTCVVSGFQNTRGRKNDTRRAD